MSVLSMPCLSDDRTRTWPAEHGPWLHTRQTQKGSKIGRTYGHDRASPRQGVWWRCPKSDWTIWVGPPVQLRSILDSTRPPIRSNWVLSAIVLCRLPPLWSCSRTAIPRLWNLSAKGLFFGLCIGPQDRTGTLPWRSQTPSHLAVLQQPLLDLGANSPSPTWTQ